MKLYKITDVFLDGGKNFKHMQCGRILDERKRDTGITWSWRQSQKGEQFSAFVFDGKDFTDWEAVKAAYLAKVQP